MARPRGYIGRGHCNFAILLPLGTYTKGRVKVGLCTPNDECDSSASECGLLSFGRGNAEESCPVVDCWFVLYLPFGIWGLSLNFLGSVLVAGVRSSGALKLGCRNPNRRPNIMAQTSFWDDRPTSKKKYYIRIGLLTKLEKWKAT